MTTITTQSSLVRHLSNSGYSTLDTAAHISQRSYDASLHIGHAFNYDGPSISPTFSYTRSEIGLLDNEDEAENDADESNDRFAHRPRFPPLSI